KGDRDQVGNERHPDAERDRNGELLLDQLQHADIAKVALAEIKQQEVLDHQQEALVRRSVEAELLFQPLDEIGVQSLRAAVFGGGIAARGARLVGGSEIT